MKKVALVFGAAAFLAFASCKKEEKEVNVDSTGVDTTVVVHEHDAPSPSKDTIVVEEPDGTSVNINSSGVSVDSKDGTKKTNINVSKDGAGVEVKK